MPRFGLRAPIAAALTLTLAGLAIAPAASADPLPVTPTSSELAATAASAAKAANKAFRSADWDGVVNNADAFDAAHASLVVKRDEAAAALEALQGSAAGASGDLDAAKEDREAKALLKDESKDALDAALRERDVDAPQAVLDANQRLETALEAQELAQGNFDDADDAYNARVSGLVAGTLWALAFPAGSTTTVKDLANSYAAAVAELADARTNAQKPTADYEAADEALETARSVFYDTPENWKNTGLCGLLNLRTAGCRTEAGQAAFGVYEPVLNARNAAYGLFLLASGAVTAAEIKQATRSSYFTSDLIAADKKSAAYQSTSEALGLANDEVDAANQAVTDADDRLKAAKKDVRDKREAFQTDKDAWLEAVQTVKDLKAISGDLDGQVDDAKQTLKEIKSLLKDLKKDSRRVADRRADLVDLQTVMEQTTVSIPAQEGAVHAGQTVELAFTVTNSQLFNLQDASVDVTSPLGVTPVCDVPADGTVPADATVSCVAEYVVTATDLLNGEVIVTVVLSGYIPLGPGNPRAKAANRTLVSVTATTTIQVEALAVVDTPEQPVIDSSQEPSAESTPQPAAVSVVVTEDNAEPVTTSAELSETGGDSLGSVTDAAFLLLVGLGLVAVSRRKFLHQK